MKKTPPPRILQEHPGYTWVFHKDVQQYVLRWKPIPGVYSPPVLDNPMRVRSFPVAEDAMFFVFQHLKDIRKKSKIRYLCFYKGQFEIWGRSDREIGTAVTLLQQRIPIR